MRHRTSGKQLSRNTSHRKALRRNMAGSLIEHDTGIVTTMAKAKELRSFVEKLITLAKKGTLHARRQVLAMLREREIVPIDSDGDPVHASSKSERVTVVTRLFDEIAPRFMNRNGGYTRIIRLGEYRIGDAGEKVMIQLLGDEDDVVKEGTSGSGKRRKRASKLYAASRGGAKEASVDEADADQAPVAVADTDQAPAADTVVDEEPAVEAEADNSPAVDEAK